MANVFAGSEIVEMGIQIEKNGRDFYDTLITQSGHGRAKEIFKYLSKEEEKHIAAFEKILEAVQKYEPPESYPGEYFAYMKALAREHVFTQKDKGKEIAAKTKNDKEAIDLGIGFERDSITFYEGMKRIVPSAQHDVVNSLIAQENDHLHKLSELKSSIM